jgi:hypothetical protein
MAFLRRNGADRNADREAHGKALAAALRRTERIRGNESKEEFPSQPQEGGAASPGFGDALTEQKVALLLEKKSDRTAVLAIRRSRDRVRSPNESRSSAIPQRDMRRTVRTGLA